MGFADELYTSWMNAKAVAFAWIGALLLPFACPLSWTHPMFWVGLGLGLLVLTTIVDGVRALRSRQLAAGLVKAVVPALLLLAAFAVSTLSG